MMVGRGTDPMFFYVGPGLVGRLHFLGTFDPAMLSVEAMFKKEFWWEPTNDIE